MEFLDLFQTSPDSFEYSKVLEVLAPAIKCNFFPSWTKLIRTLDISHEFDARRELKSYNHLYLSTYLLSKDRDHFLSIEDEAKKDSL